MAGSAREKKKTNERTRNDQQSIVTFVSHDQFKCFNISNTNVGSRGRSFILNVLLINSFQILGRQPMNMILFSRRCTRYHSPKTLKIRRDVSKTKDRRNSPVCLLERMISCSKTSKRSPETLQGDAMMNCPLSFLPTTIAFEPIRTEMSNRIEQIFLHRSSYTNIALPSAGLGTDGSSAS